MFIWNRSEKNTNPNQKYIEQISLKSNPEDIKP
jgi:hypothetical protein